MVALRHASLPKTFLPVSTPIEPAAAERMRKLAREFPPRIERRRRLRTGYRTRAWLQPVDDTAATRPPLIFTRDLDTEGLGFLASQDLSALGDAVLHLPDATGRAVRVPCHVRRSRDLEPGWFEGLLQFDASQPLFSPRRMI